LASAKAQLKADLANAKNRAKNAQSRLNRIVAINRQNNKPPRQGPEYDAQNQVFIDAGKEVARLTKALAEFKEPEKVKTKAELRNEEEELRQADIVAGRDPEAEAKRRADEKAAAEKETATAAQQQATPDVATEDFNKEYTQGVADSGRYIAGLSEPGRVQLAKTLNNVYGLKLPVNGKYSKELKDAYVRALTDNYTRSLDFNQKMSLPEFLVTAESEGTYKPGAKDSRPVVPQTTISNATQAAAIINNVIKSLTNRDATPEEVTTLTKRLNAAEAKNPYKTVNGKTTGGINREQFLIDLIKTGPKFKKIAGEIGSLKESKETATQSLLEKTARANGLTLSTFADADSWVNRINQGESIENFKQIIRNTAKAGLPDNVKKLLDDGVDLDAVYSPYKQTMAAILEINPESINLNDPTLRMGIGADKEMPLYEYQRALKQDARWQYTDNAREDVSNSVQRVLRDFGFMG
jgi:hypothetical protein